MFRRGSSALKSRIRSLHTSNPRVNVLTPSYRGALASCTVLTASALWYANTRTLHSDSSSSPAPETTKLVPSSQSVATVSNAGDTLESLVWGSNQCRTLLPDEGKDVNTSMRTPTSAAWLENVALRDIALHRRHAACVDARGDLYQWGDGFVDSESNSSQDGKPVLTLRGKNITQLQLSETQVFALSASGHVYTLAASTASQELSPGVATPASSPWWGTGWLWGEEEFVNFHEITPREHLSWGEKFVSLSAGNDHLLALTSSGRTFAHPINKNANAYGQLGLRRVEIQDPSSPLPRTTLPVELIPKSISDPYSRASPFNRSPSPDQQSDVARTIDDSRWFCHNLFEIPSLKGVEVSQVAAGGRDSFVRTSSGRVLGWGANEYGQIGLGNNIVLSTITVPTEVILWERRTQAKCLDVRAGGDLTAFTVERTASNSASKTVDVLMCGNGQWGGLGNNQYSNAQSTPVRAKNVSGLTEYSDVTQTLEPIRPHSIDVSATGHVLLTLDTSGGEANNRDLLVWGRNHEGELGNGKKSSLPVPTTLKTNPEGERFMLQTKKAKEVWDLRGQLWKRRVLVEQRAAAGPGGSIVYWKIC